MIFRWLYKRGLFGRYMPPAAFEENIVPLLPKRETEAFRHWLFSYFPNAVLREAHSNDVIELRNHIQHILRNSARDDETMSSQMRIRENQTLTEFSSP
jgi:hypothetical protein